MKKSSKDNYRTFSRSYRRVPAPAGDTGTEAIRGIQPDAASRPGDDPNSPAAAASSPSHGSVAVALERGYLREYAAWLRPFAWRIAGLLAIAMFTSLLSLVLPRATMYIIDVVLPQRRYATLHYLGFGLLVVTLIQQALDLHRHWLGVRLNASLLFRVRQRLYKHLLRLPLHELSNMKTGGITSRLSGDIDAVTGLLRTAIITPAVAGVKVLLTVAMLLWINWKMGLAAALVFPPIMFLTMVRVRRVRPIYRSMRRDRAEIDARVVETFGGIRVVRAFGREAAEVKRYAVAHNTVIRKQLLAQWFEALIRAGWGCYIPLCALSIVWLGGTLVLAGQTSVGGIIAFQMYMMMLLMPMSAIVDAYGQTQHSLAAMERVFDTLRLPADMPDRPNAVDAPQGIAAVEFEQVSFAYRDDQPVLDSISLRVEGGQTVALVGPSGAGKTTITNMVARFYDPQDGAIRLNGIDLRDIKLVDYRRLIGLVQQDVFLFDGTIAENIAYGRHDARPAAVVEAARRANAHAFITELPDGYDTIVGERGVRLSGGQAQRVSIARALLADPRILILDEATSNLDTESEQLIQAAMAELLAGRTTFIIAHRLSTVMHADLIVVLEQGRIIETGTHAELLSRDGRYREMVDRQQRGLDLEAAPADWLA